MHCCAITDRSRHIVQVPVDKNSIAYSRTPAQVVSIVTAGAKNGKGLFFPKGLNGNIK